MKNSNCSIPNYRSMLIPKEKECLADWMYSRIATTGALKLEASSKEDNEKFKKEVEESVLKVDGSIKSWPKAYSVPFRPVQRGTIRDFSGSLPLFKRIFIANDVKSLAGLLATYSDDLDLVFHLKDKDVQNAISCDDFLEKTTSALKLIKGSDPKTNNSFMLGLIGRLSNQACFDKKDYAFNKILKSIPSDYKYYSTASWYAGMSPVNIAESDSKNDMLLKEQLKLYIHYGSQFDLEDYTFLTEDEILTEIKDSILAFRIRNFNMVPWVYLTQNIEEVDVQRMLLEESLLILGTSKASDKRMLQIAYLDGYDPTPIMDPSTEEAKKAVTRIRNLSTVARSLVPRAIPISNRIHNGLHVGLIERTRKFTKTLNRKERKHKKVFIELELALKRFFALDKKPLERLEIHLKGLSKSEEALKVLKLKDDEKFLKLEKLILSELEGIEGKNLTLPKKEQAEWHKENSILLNQYVSAVRSLKELSLIAKASNKSNLKQLSELTDSKKLMNLLKDRISVFKWYILTQSKRFTDNKKIKNASADRLKKIINL